MTPHADRTPVPRRVALLVVLLGGMSVAAAAEDAAPWRQVLIDQLRHERSCAVRAFVFVNEVPLAGDTVMSGRVACIDGREFDFSRQKAHQKFEIHLCQPAVC